MLLDLRQHLSNVERGLASNGRRDVETFNWHRPSADTPCLERASRGNELQKLPQTKGSEFSSWH